MAKVKTVTNALTGTATAQVVALDDDKRAYMAMYAQTGSCLVSFGDGVHATTAITLAQGNYFETAVNVLDKVTYSGNGTTLLVIQDIDSKICLTSDAVMLSYDGEPVYYLKNGKFVVPITI